MNKMAEYAILNTKLGHPIRTQILGHHRFYYAGRIAEGYFYDEKALGVFGDEIIFRRDNAYDNVILNSGEERDGKSTLAIRLALLLNPNFSVDNISFTLDEFETLVETANDEEIIIMDEAGHAIFALNFMDKLQTMLVKKMQIIGKRKLIIILNLPHKSDLTKRLRDRRVTAWSYVFTQFINKQIKRGYCEIRLPKKSRFKQSIFWEYFMLCKYNKIDNTVWNQWEEYERRKDLFISSESITSKKKLAISTHGKRALEQRNKLISFIIDNNIMNQSEIAIYLGLTQSNISQLMKAEIDKEALEEIILESGEDFES